MARGERRTPPDELSQLLVEVRGSLSQTEAGARAAQYLPASRGAISQAKVSRAEKGLYPFSAEEADAYARGCGATAEQRRRLVALAKAYEAGSVTSRVALQRNAVAIQERIAELERSSTLIRSWQDALILGIVQIPAYLAAVAGEDPGERWLAARRARQDLLRDPGREWRLLMYEGALRWPLGSYQVMADQLDHIIEVSHLPGVHIRVVDQVTLKPSPAPPGAFHMYGSRMVVSAIEVGTNFLPDPADVSAYEEAFDRLETLALGDNETRELLASIAGEYRTRS